MTFIYISHIFVMAGECFGNEICVSNWILQQQQQQQQQQ